MSVNSNTSKIFENFLDEFPGFDLYSEKISAKREFSESVQAALSSGLNRRDLQTILDNILGGVHGAKEVQ